jgi:hypothetical protein
MHPRTRILQDSHLDRVDEVRRAKLLAHIKHSRSEICRGRVETAAALNPMLSRANSFQERVRDHAEYGTVFSD